MAYNPDQHEKVIDNTMQDIKDGVFDDIKSLENRVAELVNNANTPQDVRSPLEYAFEQSKQQIVDSVKPVNSLALDTLEQSSTPATEQDDAAIAALTEQTGRTVAGNLDSGLENIMEVVVVGTAAGVAKDLLVNQVRGRISGVFMESNDPLVRKTQRKLKKLIKSNKATQNEVADATRVIRDRLTGINTTASLRDLTTKSVQDTVMKFDAAFTAGRAERAGIERFEYAGGTTDKSRPFCMEMDGQTLTKDEIYDIWDGSHWQGKEPGDPFVVRGGYNCMHFWVPVEED